MSDPFSASDHRVRCTSSGEMARAPSCLHSVSNFDDASLVAPLVASMKQGQDSSSFRDKRVERSTDCYRRSRELYFDCLILGIIGLSLTVPTPALSRSFAVRRCLRSASGESND